MSPGSNRTYALTGRYTMKDRQLLLAIMAQLEREKIVSIPQLAMLLGIEEQRVFDALEVLVFA